MNVYVSILTLFGLLSTPQWSLAATGEGSARMSPDELRDKLQQNANFDDVIDLLKIASREPQLQPAAIQYLDQAKLSAAEKFESWLTARGWKLQDRWDEFQAYKQQAFDDFTKHVADSGDPAAFEMLKHLCESALTVHIGGISKLAPFFPPSSPLNDEFIEYAYQGVADRHYIFKERADGEGGRLTGILNAKTGEYRPYYTPDEEAAWHLVNEKQGAFLLAHEAIPILYLMKTTAADQAILRMLSTSSVWQIQGIAINLQIFKDDRYTERVFPFFMAAFRNPENRHVQNAVEAFVLKENSLFGRGQSIENADPAMYPKLLQAISLIETIKLVPRNEQATAELKARILELQAARPPTTIAAMPETIPPSQIVLDIPPANTSDILDPAAPHETVHSSAQPLLVEAPSITFTSVADTPSSLAPYYSAAGIAIALLSLLVYLIRHKT